MLLAPDEVRIFYDLQRRLMCFVNERLQAVPGGRSPDEIAALSVETRLALRNAWLEHPELTEAFAAENPAGLSEEQREIVRSWRHHIAGGFFVFSYLKNYAIFLAQSAATAYAVRGLIDPFEILIGRALPVWVHTVLLPFRDKIVYDGLMTCENITFGGGIKRMLNESYREAKDRQGIVTSLPAMDKPAPRLPAAKPSKTKQKTKPPVSAGDQTRAILEAVIGMTDEFCREKLNEEYAVLCRKLAEKLARKRPSPLLGGRLAAWASGIVRTIGWVNFLHDKSQTPHMRLIDIDEWFGISESTGAARLATIRKMLKIHQFDHHWTLPSGMDDNPLIWTVEVDGFSVDIRHMPRELQEAAFRKGIIPYVPADRDA